MTIPTFAAAVLAVSPLFAQTPSAPSRAPVAPKLDLSYEIHAQTTVFRAELDAAPAGLWGLAAQASGSQPFLVAAASPGAQELELTVKNQVLAGLPPEPIHVFAVVITSGGQVVFSPPVPYLGGSFPCEPISFSHTPAEGTTLAPGTPVTGQWSLAGVHVSATNNTPGHPDVALILDSSNPPPGDPDLVTPGYGPGNDTALGNLLIIAENDVDADGDALVDVPDDEAGGGVMRLDFDEPVTFCALTIVDLENGEDNEARFFDASGALIDVLDLPLKGDNSVQKLGKTVFDVSAIELHVADSFGVPSVEVVMCPTRLRFDLETAGAPTGLQEGEILSDQLAHRGIDMSAQSFGLHDVTILFNSADPTGGDLNLADPEEGLVMIIAENVDDADGDALVDVPDDEAKGGVLTIEFTYDVELISAEVMDVDTYETSFFELYDADGALMEVVPLQPLGDGSKQTVTPRLTGVRRVELHLGGSGALSEILYCPLIEDTLP